MGAEPLAYCRDIESYLCQKNGGHLVRIVGPSFDLVAQWAADGIPFKVACAGIDRYCERRARRPGTVRIRPARIEHCDADVREAFEAWRRALGLQGAAVPAGHGEGRGADAIPAADAYPEETRSKASLPSHLERVLARLSTARALGRLGEPADAVIDRISQALDDTRRHAHGLRGAARAEMLDRLRALDAELVEVARVQLSPADASGLAAEAEHELAAFRNTMPPDAYRAACLSAEAHLVRQRFELPTIALT